MKKKISRIVTAVLMALTIMITVQSCSSMAALMQDEDFREGFRQGWNSTAPAEWRY